MRIDLNVPFAEKDEAKKMGAWWDGYRRTWYVKDVEDLTPFARWFKARQDSRHEVPAPITGKKAQKIQASKDRQRARMLEPVTTHSSVYIAHCGCDVLPWEDCEHTDASMWIAGDLDEANMAHLRSIK